jgi:hypothetical protein
MISFDDFITHTFRNRKNALNFFWIMIDASLKFFLIHSANFVWNEFHRLSFSSSFHSRILFSTIWVLDSYFFFDFSVCSSLSVSFSLSRIETRLRLASDDSKVIYRLAEMNAGLQRWMSTCRSECEIKEFEIKLKKFNDRCENRFVEFFSLWLQIADSEIDCLISR